MSAIALSIKDRHYVTSIWWQFGQPHKLVRWLRCWDGNFQKRSGNGRSPGLIKARPLPTERSEAVLVAAPVDATDVGGDRGFLFCVSAPGCGSFGVGSTVVNPEPPRVSCDARSRLSCVWARGVAIVESPAAG